MPPLFYFSSLPPRIYSAIIYNIFYSIVGYILYICIYTPTPPPLYSSLPGYTAF